MKKYKFVTIILIVGSYTVIIALSFWRLDSISPATAHVTYNAFTVSSKQNNSVKNSSVIFTPPDVDFEDSLKSLSLSGLGSHTEVSLRQAREINYGCPLKSGKRTPLVMARLALGKDVHNLLLNFTMFSCSEEKLDHMGLDKRVRVPIYIFEGYFHSLSTPDKFYSKNPNPEIGIDFMKPAADSLLRSFFEAFRQINSGVFEKMSSDLVASAIMRNHLHPENDACYFLANWIRDGRHFGDLSIQIHYGRGNEPTFKRAWHVDAENSLLHLAVTLRGRRTLHSRRRKTPYGDPDEVKEIQNAGDVYLSSSALMMHAPKFSDTDYNSRVVAIHARILYTSAEINTFRALMTDESWECLTNIIAENLAVANIRIPNVVDIEKILSKLSSSN